jgi:tetratricopeptide (TPR) repeat protein
MAKKRSNYPKGLSVAAVSAPEESLAPAPAEAAVGESAPPHEGGLPTKFWVVLYLVMFLAAMGVIFGLFVFAGGDSKEQRKMLFQAEQLAGRGEHLEANRVLEAFADRWPNARNSGNWRLHVGRNFLAAGEFAKAAEHLELSVEYDPGRRDTRALAGEALLKLGERDKAARMFAAELADGNDSSDTARYHLGEMALEDGRLVEAFRYFEAIGDREAYASELAEARALAENTILEPARQAALAN